MADANATVRISIETDFAALRGTRDEIRDLDRELTKLCARLAEAREEIAALEDLLRSDPEPPSDVERRAIGVTTGDVAGKPTVRCPECGWSCDADYVAGYRRGLTCMNGAVPQCDAPLIYENFPDADVSD